MDREENEKRQREGKKKKKEKERKMSEKERERRGKKGGRILCILKPSKTNLKDFSLMLLAVPGTI